MKVGILTGGGDCPGLNAVIRAVVRKGIFHYDDEFVGFMEGWRGLIENQSMALNLDSVSGILPRGGTILRTSRTNPSKRPDGFDRCMATIAAHKIDALIAIGGDDTLSVAQKLHEKGVNVVGVPKTIDNDLGGTDYTFGFDTACNIVCDAIDRVHTTAEAHNRVMVVEVMGRDAGWIALHGGIAGGADIILLPEIPFTYESVAETIKARSSQGLHSTLIVVAEGVKQPGTNKPFYKEVSETRENKLGGAGDTVAYEVQRLTGKQTRACVLGHLQRGGAPTALDRILGVRFGVMAVNLIKEGKFGHMVSYQSYHVDSVPIADAVKQTKLVQNDSEVVMAARAVGISFGDSHN